MIVNAECAVWQNTQNIMSGMHNTCTIWLHWHYKVAGYIQWMIRKHMGLQVTEKYYEHTPEKVRNASGTTIMWDVPVVTDWTIVANRPDMALHNKKDRTCLLFATVIPDDSNINTKETEKLSKYKDLEIKVSRMWKVRTKIVSVIIWALGTIKKGLDKKLQMLPDYLSARELQKTTLMRTAHIIFKVMG